MSRLEELLQQQKEIAVAIEVEVAKGRAAAALGEAVAQFNLGLMFEKGQGVAQSYREAKRCYKQAADQGSAPALYSLGVLFEKGLGEDEDFGDLDSDLQ